MSDIIHLLPDSVANQIAAGEVIQRPASVIKELVENALDAGATDIQIILKDAGRTLIQVIDNGKGMSATDARLAFERHATSKIKSADDLFALRTMGFRGEALASIAAVAQVELKTRREEDEVGTHISIAGSMVEEQTAISCPIGCIFSVKNIFFNVPARRKFLKSNNVEWNNILTEFERIALVNQHVSFRVIHNENTVIALNASSARQRIVELMGKNLNQQLIPVEVNTSFISISGFIGNPDAAKKRASQYFFVNDRYMRHPYFNKAVLHCYEQLLSAGDTPPYFLYLQVDPASIDVNIHPTKTEIKFENEQPIWQIIMAAVKEALGKHNAVPSIDFDTLDAPDIPIFGNTQSSDLQPPKVHFNTEYNPFKTNTPSYPGRAPVNSNWEKLYHDFELGSQKEESPIEPEIEPLVDQTILSPLAFEDSNIENRQLLQIKGKYILTSSKSGLMLIDQRRAHIRVMFDTFIDIISTRQNASQGILFPEMIQLTPAEASLMPLLNEDLCLLGFDMGDLGNFTYSINAIPTGIEGKDYVTLLHNILTTFLEKGCDIKEEIHHILALSLAETAAINYGKLLNDKEIQMLIDQLFRCNDHSLTPEGKTIITIISNDELEKRFR
jgi:DNA mismatch repair protein MutL